MLGANATEHQCSWETSQLPSTSSQPRASVPACWLTSQQMNELNHIRLILHQGHLVGDEAANYKEGNINSLVLRSHMTYFGNHMTIQRRHCCHVHINTRSNTHLWRKVSSVLFPSSFASSNTVSCHWDT